MATACYDLSEGGGIVPDLRCQLADQIKKLKQVQGKVVEAGEKAPSEQTKEARKSPAPPKP